MQGGKGSSRIVPPETILSVRFLDDHNGQPVAEQVEELGIQAVQKQDTDTDRPPLHCCCARGESIDSCQEEP